MRFLSGFRYQVVETFAVSTRIQGNKVVIDFARLFRSGLLVIEKGFAWDGASGPAIDSRSVMRGAAAHDALYRMMRAGMLSRKCRKAADLELYRACLQDGMGKLRAAWVYLAVRLFGWWALRRQDRVFEV